VRKRLLVFTASLILFVAAPSAWAGDQQGFDAAEDMIGARDNRGDIRITRAEFWIGHDTVTMGTAVNETPANWGTGSFIRWWIATSNQTLFYVLYTYEASGLTANLYDENGYVVCATAASFNPKHNNPYRSEFSNKCLGSPKSWAIKGEMRYVDHNGNVTEDEASECCEVYNN
jgi:hypothetical protein